MSANELMVLLRAIATGDRRRASALIKGSPHLARASASVGASRGTSTAYHFSEIGQYVYAGDTALHFAAAAYRADISNDLVAHGANPGARNRRGAEPLHYAAVGFRDRRDGIRRLKPTTIEFLIRSGSNPNSTDKSGVTPLHRAVRTRCAAAVLALLAHGANPLLRNASGSTPLHLAVQNTGRGGSGTTEAREEQAAIIRLLVEHGARLTDKDSTGKSVAASVAGGWVEEVFRQFETRPK